MLDGLQDINREHFGLTGDPEIETRISQYEMAFRMQASVPGLLDFSNEPKSVLEMYGPDVLTPGTFANNCLIARRLAERGVRFTQLMHSGWDQHNNLTTGQLAEQCKDTDQPSAALVKDLKQRGLLDDTLVVWGGEFGRTPFGQNQAGQGYKGRDHFGRAYSWWLAGAGVKAGHWHGETDDFGWNITKDPVHVHDMQATIMRLFGINHEALTYRYQGRQFRLTDVHGHAVKGILA
jgi:arylsulfatase A-like enzyme